MAERNNDMNVRRSFVYTQREEEYLKATLCVHIKEARLFSLLCSQVKRVKLLNQDLLLAAQKHNRSSFFDRQNGSIMFMLKQDNPFKA